MKYTKVRNTEGKRTIGISLKQNTFFVPFYKSTTQSSAPRPPSTVVVYHKGRTLHASFFSPYI